VFKLKFFDTYKGLKQIRSDQFIEFEVSPQKAEVGNIFFVKGKTMDGNIYDVLGFFEEEEEAKRAMWELSAKITEDLK